ncbi:MAG: S8 family serine peptidase [Candidatus Delongbacteria bacterium]
MKQHVLLVAGLALLATAANALDNRSLKPRFQLPRGQFLELTNPADVYVDHVRVKFRETSRVRLRDGAPVSLEGEDLSPVKAFLARHPELRLLRRWTLSEEVVDAYVARGEERSGLDLADLNNWYSLELKGDNRDPQGLLKELLALELVETCHYHPRPAEATCGPDVAPPTPDYSSLQGYRDPAPVGVGIDHAWSLDPAYGNGIPSYDIQDVEQSWCVGHEDIDSDFTVYDTQATEGNHGLAVVSIMGACDNGFGITGLVPEARFSGRSWQSDSGSFPDVSNTLLSTGQWLDPGEMYLIEIHAHGPGQGTTCTCNCDQFEYVAMEYWQDNFDVIQANTANGRICVEAAGNGSMDLDGISYNGAFNRSLRDSGALLVGAADSPLPHNASCWTNHGSRVDFFGWGDGVCAAGYGASFDQDGCTQDYTQFFSGTSSATPIVAGAAASLALILRNQSGEFPTPLALRSMLQGYGTPQGPVDSHKEIGVMPNLGGIDGNNLLPATPAGWHGPLVPANSIGAHLPANLLPSPTYNALRLNWFYDALAGSTGGAHARLWRDDAEQMVVSTPDTEAGQFGDRNVSHTDVRGGRHYLRMALDVYDVVEEVWEGDNSYTESFCWDAVPLADGVPATFSRGPRPNPQGSVEQALDGYSNGGNFTGWWEAFGVVSSVNTDYDLQLFDEAPTSTSGWTDPVASSQQSLYTDFVGCNNNTGADADWVGVINQSDGSDAYTLEGQGSSYVGVPPSTTSTMASGELAVGEVLDIFEFQAVNTNSITFELTVTDGMATPALFVYPASTTLFSRATAALSLLPSGGNGGVGGVFTPATPGYHALVVCKNLRSEGLHSATYTLTWGPARGDLTHATPAGWSGSLVPRVSSGTVGQLPSLLLPGTTVLDVGYANLGPGTVSAGFNQRFTVDGVTVETSADLAALAAGASAQRTAVSPGTLKGGRHEIGSLLDCNNEKAESPPGGETNNRAYVQHVWSATSLAAHTPQSHSSAPNFENRDNPFYSSQPGANQDGYRFTVNGWTGVAALPAVANAGTCVYGYTYASNNSTTGFLNPAVSSLSPEGSLCLVMFNGHQSGENQGRNVGVANSQPWPVQPPSGTYTIQAAPAQGLLEELVPLSGTLAGSTSTGGQILHVYELDLAARERCSLSLDNQSGVRLGLAVFPPGAACLDNDDALLTANPGQAGADASGSFVASLAGRYGVAVYRCEWDDLGPAAAYTLMRGQREPAQPLIAQFTPVDFENGHAVMHLEITPVIVDVNGNPLVVDAYKLYVDDDPWLGSPQVATMTTTSMDLYFHNIGMPTRAFLRVTAVDENGVVLADSRPELPLPAQASAAPTGWVVPHTGSQAVEDEHR